MRRIATLLGLALLGLAVSCIPVHALTIDQAKRYVARVLIGKGADTTDAEIDALIKSFGAGLDAVAWQIMNLDDIEHATPAVTVPAAAMIFTDDGKVSFAYQGPLVVDVSSGKLLYKITLPPVTATAAPTDRPWWELPAIIAGSAACGAVVVLAVQGLASIISVK